jgi:hypothetical protein
LGSHAVFGSELGELGEVDPFYGGYFVLAHLEARHLLLAYLKQTGEVNVEGTVEISGQFAKPQNALEFAFDIQLFEDLSLCAALDALVRVGSASWNSEFSLQLTLHYLRRTDFSSTRSTWSL